MLGFKGVVDRMMTSLFLVHGAIDTGTDVVEVVVVVVGVVGAVVVMGAVDVLVVPLFSCVLVLWGC